jgi:Flp pilus assembly protein TadD
MTHSGQYGRSFAAKHLAEERFDEALLAAHQAIEHEPTDPEHHIDCAQALVGLGREAEALPAFLRAVELDAEAQVLEIDLVDDDYFSALLVVARAMPEAAQGAARLADYARAFPEGRHLRDAEDWARRLRGELRSEFVKRRLEDITDAEID